MLRERHCIYTRAHEARMSADVLCFVSRMAWWRSMNDARQRTMRTTRQCGEGTSPSWPEWALYAALSAPSPSGLCSLEKEHRPKRAPPSFRSIFRLYNVPIKYQSSLGHLVYFIPVPESTGTWIWYIHAVLWRCYWNIFQYGYTNVGLI